MKRIILAAALAALAFHAAAQQWPSKPIRIVVPYPPGGSSDIIARAISQPLSEALKQTVIVENRAGANGNTGTDAVAKSNDGHTLLWRHRRAGDHARGLQAAALRSEQGSARRHHAGLLAAPAGGAPSVPANNLQELVALSHKDKLNFAVTAIGSAPHLAGVAVEKATRPSGPTSHKGGSQAIGDTVAGQTQVLMNGMLATLPMVQSGKLKVLGVSKATRVPLLAIGADHRRAGREGLRVGHLAGRAGAGATPPAVVNRLGTELTRIIRLPEVRERLVSQGAEVYTMTPPEFSRLLRARAQELGRWSPPAA